MSKIVLRLDRMMVERKMSLNELAERVGISNVNLSKIKNNKVIVKRAIFWNFKKNDVYILKQARSFVSLFEHI